MTQIESKISGNQRAGTLWYMANVAAGSPTIHIAPSSIGNRYSWGWVVISGVKTSSPLDVSAIGSTTTASSRTGSVTTTVANALTLLFNFNLYNASTNSTKTFGTGDDHNLFHNTADKSAGSFSMTADYTSSQENAYIMAAFKPNANNYTQSLTEAITLNDISTAKVTAKVITDVVTMVDTVQRNVAKALLDSVTLVASAATQFIYSRTLSDAIALTDTITKKAGKLVTDSVTLVASMRRSMARAITDTVTIVDTVDTILVYVRAFTETVTLTASSAAKITAKVLTESLSLDDAAATIKTYVRAFTETVTMVDTTARTLARTIADSITATDTVSKVTVYARYLMETISLQDRLRGLLNGINMLYNNKYTDKAVTYFKKYIDPK